MSFPAGRAQGDEPLAFDETPGPPGFDPVETEEVDLSTLLDLQDERHLAESRQSTRLILRFFGFLLIVAGFWYAVSAGNRRKVDGLIQDVKDSRRDLQQISSPEGMTASYDQVLEKLGTRATDIDTASQSLGVDPAGVPEDGMDAEMKTMMGGEGRTAGERQRVVEGVAHAVGMKAPTTHAAAAVSAKPVVAPAHQVPSAGPVAPK